jgi:hypothetical protein
MVLLMHIFYLYVPIRFVAVVVISKSRHFIINDYIILNDSFEFDASSLYIDTY